MSKANWRPDNGSSKGMHKENINDLHTENYSRKET
jgi:hypothetical protein